MIQHVLDDSFYLWANGGWLRKKVKLSDQKNDSSGILEDARIRVQKDLQDIMDRLTMADRNSLSEREKKILDFYHASTNTAIIEGKGLSEFLPVLQTCRRINEDPSGVLAELHSQYGVNTLFCLRSMIDRKNSDNTKCSLFLDTTRGFYKDFEHLAGLGSNDYHDRAKPLAHETRTHFPEGIDQLDKYEIMIHRAFDILGSYDIVRYKSTEYNKSLAREIVKLQVELIKSNSPADESRLDPLQTYNIFEVDGLQELTKGAPISTGAYLAFGPVNIQDFNWRSYFEKCGQDPDAVGDMIVEQPEALSMLNFALNTSYIIDYLVLQCFESFSPHMTSKTQNWAQDLHNMLGSSASIVKTNSESSVRLVDMYFGETLGEIYREKNYNPRTIQIVRDMSNRLKLELHDSLNRCDWFEEKTKLEALEKLAALEVQIWGPSKLCNKELEFTINRDAHFANVIECRRCIFKYELGLMNQPTDRDLWLSSPQTVNAFYLPSLNRVTIPAGILQYPLFDVNSDTAIHYGSLGKIIAHEMAHAFDDFGRMFDYNGNVRNWWSPKDEVAYHERILSKLSNVSLIFIPYDTISKPYPFEINRSNFLFRVCVFFPSYGRM